jgi:hypothetical protein
LAGPFLILLIVLAVAAPTAAPSATKRAGDPTKTDAKREGDFLQGPPMVLYLAKGQPDACGVGCSEWIAAEGIFDRGAAERFRAFLQRQGQRKLPVYFHSPGGALSNALAIGRLMRQRGVTAGVGRTIPQGCDPLREREPACDAIKRSGRQLAAELRSARAVCGSACVYALVGAKLRLVPSGARLGVHASALARCDHSGCVRLSSATKMTREQLGRIESDAAQLTRYFREMGIDTTLLDAAKQIPHESVRFLSRDEIARFGIDRREFHESFWMIDEGPPGPFAVIKFVTEAIGSDRKEYRTTRIRLTCGGQAQNDWARDEMGIPRPQVPNIWVEYDRELASSDSGVTVPISLVGRGGDIAFPPRRRAPIIGYNNVPMDDRRARVAVTLLETVAAGDVIEIAEKLDRPQGEQRSRVTKISTAGMSGPLATLRSRCRHGISF